MKVLPLTSKQLWSSALGGEWVAIGSSTKVLQNIHQPARLKEVGQGWGMEGHSLFPETGFKWTSP